MLELCLLALLVSGMIAMVMSKRVRASVLVAGLAVLFMPFGVLVAIGWVLPKALQIVLPYLPLKDAIS
ncbi:MAG TPA: hypothetical protein VFO10_08365 [Oligoflexus sp.]|uniref:hypothetical protein n=1 Tax=Oligoflexus sp. TaxID=1971216 RepID=UPI002D80BFDC|nr:hypothetical protein [Oligoflexus sp.]HET9237251.1 hypothetical protein [Oligoflexus sp.]